MLTPTVAYADPPDAPTVAGMLELPEGCVAEDGRVILEHLSATPYVDGAALNQIASGQVGKDGRFSLHVPATPELVAAAQWNGGTLNVNLLADMPMRSASPGLCLGDGEEYPAPDLGPLLAPLLGSTPDTSTVTNHAHVDVWYLLSYGFSLELVNTSDGDEAMVFAPVNAGMLLIADYAVGHLGLTLDPVPQPSSSPQPDDSSVVPVDAAAVAPHPGVNGPGVSMADAVPETDASDQLPADEDLTEPYRNQPSENEAYDPYERCRKPENWKKTFIDTLQEASELEPIGELHTSTDMTGKYDYGTSAHTEFGIGVSSPEGWKVSGKTSIKNKTGSGARAVYNAGANFGRHIVSKFRHVDERITHCGTSCCAERDPKPTVYRRVRSIAWQGGALSGVAYLGGWDTAEQRDKAVKEGRDAEYQPGGEFVRTGMKSVKYTFEVNVFGVQLFAESLSAKNTEHKVVMGQNRPRYWVWGLNGPPVAASTTAVYAYA